MKSPNNSMQRLALRAPLMLSVVRWLPAGQAIAQRRAALRCSRSSVSPGHHRATASRESAKPAKRPARAAV